MLGWNEIIERARSGCGRSLRGIGSIQFQRSAGNFIHVVGRLCWQGCLASHNITHAAGPGIVGGKTAGMAAHFTIHGCLIVGMKTILLCLRRRAWIDAIPSLKRLDAIAWVSRCCGHDLPAAGCTLGAQCHGIAAALLHKLGVIFRRHFRLHALLRWDQVVKCAGHYSPLGSIPMVCRRLATAAGSAPLAMAARASATSAALFCGGAAAGAAGAASAGAAGDAGAKS